ncbi:MAG: hypothetical protein U0326_30120 [Polyangiales bacterium]
MMNPSNADSLRALLRRIAWTLAASSLAACSSTVTDAPPDASTDTPPADVPAVDRPVVDTPPTDVPMIHDVPVMTDVPVTDTPPADGPPADVDPCEGRPVSTMNPCLGSDLLFECGLPAGVTPVDGGFASTDCQRICGTAMGFPAFTCELAPTDGGRGVMVHCNYACGVGRRADGFRWDDGACDGLGGWFAHVSALEGAAVAAFDRMADELRAWGAPDDLVAEAMRARADEVDHERRTAELAARFGATPVPFSVAEPGRRSSKRPRSRTSSRGACARPTAPSSRGGSHGARATPRSPRRCASSPKTRPATPRSWRVHAWMRTRLDDAAIARVEGHRREAIAALREELRGPLPTAVITWAGLPSGDDGAALLAALTPSLA